MIISVAISPSIDVTLLVDHLRVGEGHRPQEVIRLAGGKGFNVARAAHTLGGCVTAVGIVGGHAGRWLTQALSDEGITAHLVDTANETRSCITVVDAASRTVTDFYPHATPINPDEWRCLTRQCERLLLGQPGWLTICGSYPTGMPLGAIAELTSVAHVNGWKVAVDTSGQLLEAALDAAVDLIKVNAAEAAAVVGDGAPQQLAARLGRHAATAIVTNGVDGAYTTDHHVTASVQGSFPVGSGDSFLAGYLVAIDEGPEAALRLAAGAASANAEVPGAARFIAKRARQLADQASINPSTR